MRPNLALGLIISTSLYLQVTCTVYTVLSYSISMNEYSYTRVKF